jgi:hypothetical protein
LNFAESLLEKTNAMVDETPVSLELCFTRPAHSDTAAKLLEVSPHSHESRQHVLELCELDLHFCFRRSRACCEDVEDQFSAIHHALARCILDVFSLRGCELVIEDDQSRFGLGN